MHQLRVIIPAGEKGSTHVDAFRWLKADLFTLPMSMDIKQTEEWSEEYNDDAHSGGCTDEGSQGKNYFCLCGEESAFLNGLHFVVRCN